MVYRYLLLLSFKEHPTTDCRICSASVSNNTAENIDKFLYIMDKGVDKNQCRRSSVVLVQTMSKKQ